MDIGLRKFAREADVPVTTLQGTEEGKPPRQDTAVKYAKVLRRYGVDPLQVREIREALEEEEVLVVNAPEIVLSLAAMKSWEALTEGFVRNGYIVELREKLDRIEQEHGEEGRRHREQEEEAHRRLQQEEDD